VIGAVTGLSVVEGALIGAGVGGVTGLLTDQDDINLGKPVWEWGEDSSSSSAQAAPAGAQTAAVNSSGSVVREVQSSLARLGYDPGPVDGAMGPNTAAAIRGYQQQNGLLVDGRASPALAEHLRKKLAGG
jgi:peptidoglycan hydrolase-like protein with peptidoglycan-binding domain